MGVPCGVLSCILNGYPWFPAQLRVGGCAWYGLDSGADWLLFYGRAYIMDIRFALYGVRNTDRREKYDGFALPFYGFRRGIKAV